MNSENIHALLLGEPLGMVYVTFVQLFMP